MAFLVDSLSSEYAIKLWRAVQRAANKHGVDTIAFAGLRVGGPSIAEVAQSRIYELVTPTSVDGVILISAVLAHYCGKEGIAALAKRYAPMPLCSVGLEIEGVPSLIVDNFGGMRQGTLHLLDVHRCRRVAFLAAQPNSPESNERLDGYRQAHADLNLEVDEDLIVHGNFTLASGADSMRRLLDRSIPFDSVIAANDYMALGAMDVLQERNPTKIRTLPVFGFDDIAAASCAKPSLSTLRQPLAWMGAQAVTTILQQLEGRSVPACTRGEIEVVRRESCGCGYTLVASVWPPSTLATTLRSAMAKHRSEVERRMREEVLTMDEDLGDWPKELLDALDQELAGTEGSFAASFESLLDRAEESGARLDEFQRLITLLRGELRSFQPADSRELDAAERIWHAARLSVAAASIRYVGRLQIETEHATMQLGRSGERFATTLSLPLLRQAVVEEFPELRIERASIALFESGFDSPLKPLVVTANGVDLTATASEFAAKQLAPAELFQSDRTHHFVALPLTFESETLGLALFSAGAMPEVYWAVRQQIGSAIKGAHMHRQVVAQVALRERLEQTRVREETGVAAEIQTSMVPTNVRVSGLEIAHAMLPAAESGGDYYDILPHESGAWIAVGDVAGHGLGAGLIMLMLQSMISSLIRNDREIAPSRVINTVNQAIFENVHHRLHRDDHATLTVLHYERRGTFRFSGAHEPIVIYRAQSQLCETIIPPGFWVGALADVQWMLSDAELTLQDGDIMLLYTDGITEPRNAQLEQFGLKRLIGVLMQCATRPVASIRDEIIASVRAWSSSLDDDASLVILRYSAER